MKLAALAAALLGSGSARMSRVAVTSLLPDLRAYLDSCHVPAPTAPLALAAGSGAGRLRVEIRSPMAPAWRGDTFVRAIGPLAAAPHESARDGHDGTVEIADVASGRYVLMIGAIGFLPRVDTVEVSERGLLIAAPLERAPSHGSCYHGDETVQPGRSSSTNGRDYESAI